tara:strand:- start:1285 stop:1779 length:495 start_codon:yes stop_codon:yes gene_type:complete
MESNNLVDIPDYDNYKFDLDLGQVYSIKKNKYLKNCFDSKGYYQVGLYKNGKARNFYIHRLNYISNNPTEDLTGYEIDHIDNNKLNNKIENLRKCSPSNNCSNKKSRIDNTSGYKYIIKTKYGYKFQLVKNKIRYYKTFKNLQDSIEYRDKIVLEKCGEFANLG